MKISGLFETIRTTAGATAKSDLLEANMSDVITAIFNDTYDSHVRYYVKKFDMPEETGTYTLEENYDKFHRVLEALANREVTGNDAIALVQQIIGSFVAEDQPVLKAIMDRNLKIGLSKETFARIAGAEAAPQKFEVTLAKKIEDVKDVNPISGKYYASRKCDGCRCVGFITKENGKTDIVFKSRSNRLFTTLDNLIEGVAWYVRDLPDGKYVTDGEICKVDENGDEDFQAIMKEIRRKNYTIPDPCYQMFDFCTQDEWDGKSVSPKFTERLKAMQARMKGNKFKTIKLLEQELVTTQEIYDKWIERSLVGDWEGIMLRADVPFARGRTANLLKVKPFDDDEFKVFDIDVGEMTTSLPGQGNITIKGVRAIMIKEYHGGVVHVGTGLSRDQRIDWAEHPEHIIGKSVCVKWQKNGNTQNQAGEWSLRIPVLKWVYDEERDV